MPVNYTTENASSKMRRFLECTVLPYSTEGLVVSLMICNLLSNLLDRSSRSLLASESERESEREREGYDDAGEESLDEADRDAELNERGEEGEDPDRPLGDGSQEVCRLNASSSCRSDDDLSKNVSDDDGNQEDEYRDYHLWEIEENHALEEDVYLVKAENLERGDEERDDDEPFDEASDERTRVKLEARSLDDLSEARLLESSIKLESLDNLRDESADESGDNPSDDKNDDGDNEVRKERHYAHPDSLK